MRTSSFIAALAIAGLAVAACGPQRGLTSSAGTSPAATESRSAGESQSVDVTPQTHQESITDVPNPRLGAAADAEVFASSLHMYASGDPVYPTSFANVFELFDIVAIGTITGLTEGRYELLGEDSQSGDPIIARYINIEVEPDEFLQGERRSSDRPLALERPWPSNLKTDGLVETLPLGNRVLILGNYQDMDYVQRTSGPLVATGTVDASTVAENLMVIPEYGLIIEDGNSAVTLEEGNIFDFASRAFGVEIKGFNGAISLLRDESPQQ